MIFIPEVFADALQTEFLGKMKLAGLSAQVSGLEGTPGNAINLPYFTYAGDAEIIAAGLAATPASLTGTAVKATVKKAVSAFAITDEDVTQGAGDPLGQIRLQMAEALAGAVDTALMTAALTTALSVGASNAVITRDNLVDAQATLGDKAEGSVLVIHSKQLADIYKDDNFISAATLGAPIMVGGIAAVGMFYGMPVLISDRVNKTVGNVYSALVIKPQALVLGYKRAPIVEEQRDVLKGQSYIVANVHFACALAQPTLACKILTL